MTETKKELKGTGYAMPSDCVQEVLESAKNASDKSASAFFTPIEFAELCAIPLPAVRNNICDLNAGTGHFLIGAANPSSRALLANDIQNVRTINHEGSKFGVSRVCADVTKLYPLLKEVNWKCDLFVANPPFDLHWYRDRLSLLSESTVNAVVESFAEFDPRLGKDTIDSTCASLMMMLDLMPYRGEGVMIANEATLQRLIFGYRAPHSALAEHIWAHLVIKGNPMTGDKRSQWDNEEEGKEYKTGVIWFAKGHFGGVTTQREDLDGIEAFKEAVKSIERYQERSGSSVTADYQLEVDCLALWGGVKDEWNLRTGRKANGGYNIWLDPDGTIKTNLSLFDQRSVKIDKQEAKRLFELAGQRPLQLVMQAQQRAALQRATNGKLWRVHPDLPKVVADAVMAYHAIRSPLYPLNPIQRLGFCDEVDTIMCSKTIYIEDLIDDKRLSLHSNS